MVEGKWEASLNSIKKMGGRVERREDRKRRSCKTSRGREEDISVKASIRSLTVWVRCRMHTLPGGLPTSPSQELYMETAKHGHVTLT